LGFYQNEWELSRDAEVPAAVAESLTELERFDEASRWTALTEQQGVSDAGGEDAGAN